MVITTAHLHSTKPELRLCTSSNSARCVSDICDNENLRQWSRLDLRLNAFRLSTIPQEQIIIIKFQEINNKSVSKDVEKYVPKSGRRSQNLNMKHHLYPKSIQNINLYFTYESKMQHYVFFFSLWNHLWSINDSFKPITNYEVIKEFHM